VAGGSSRAGCGRGVARGRQARGRQEHKIRPGALSGPDQLSRQGSPTRASLQTYHSARVTPASLPSWLPLAAVEHTDSQSSRSHPGMDVLSVRHCIKKQILYIFK
jgi:hypothetical protein